MKKKTELTVEAALPEEDYVRLLIEVKTRVREAQYAALKSVHMEYEKYRGSEKLAPLVRDRLEGIDA